MSDLVVGKVNKVSSGQKFYSWPEFDIRVSRLEAEMSIQVNQIKGLADDVEELLKLVQQITDKHNQHLKFGHKEGKKND